MAWLAPRGATGLCSPLRAFESKLGVQDPVGFWDPAGSPALLIQPPRGMPGVMAVGEARRCLGGLLQAATTVCGTYSTTVMGSAMECISLPTYTFRMLGTTECECSWHISHRAWNRLMHALHGNGGMGKGGKKGKGKVKGGYVYDE